MKDDIYIKYLRKYYEEHGTINDIPNNFRVSIEGQDINISNFLIRMKHLHRAFLLGENNRGSLSELSIARYQTLEEMGISWGKTSSDIYINSLKKYYEENGTINDIPSDFIVSIEGQTVNIGAFLSRMRSLHKNFLKGISDHHYGSFSRLSIARYKSLDEMEIDWEGPHMDYNPEEDIYIRYLRWHYEQHGSINNISRNEVIEFGGRKLRIGVFLQNIRADHKQYLLKPDMIISSTAKGRMDALDSLHYSWIPERARKSEEDLYIPFLKEYYKEHGTINDIEANFTVIYEGIKLNVATFLANMRSLYKKMENGEEISLLNRSRIQALGEMGYYFRREDKDAYIDFLRNYYKDHGTINDIDFGRTFIYNGEEINVGKFLYSIRFAYKKYLEDSSNRLYNGPLMVYRYQELGKLGFDWTVRLRGNSSDDIYIRYLQWRFDKNGTINDIGSSDVVEFEGKVVKIGVFLANVRRRHRLYLTGSEEGDCNSSLFLARYKALDEMNFQWNPKLSFPTQKDDDHDPYIEYLKKHYAKHGTIDNIKYNGVVLFEGKELQIGAFLSTVKTSYKKYLVGDAKPSSLLLRRYEELQKMGYDLSKQKYASHDEKSRLFDELNEKFHNPHKATLFARLIRREERENTSKHKKYTLDYVSSIFQLNVRQFISEFSGKIEPAYKNFNGVDGDTSLKEFASMYGYQYRALLYATRLRENNLAEEDITSLINRGVIETDYRFKWKTPNWIYSKYGNRKLLDDFIESTGFDLNYFYEDMRKEVIPIEEAILDESFRINSQDGEYYYLKPIYEEALDYYKRCCQETRDPSLIDGALNIYLNTRYVNYALTGEEIEVISRSLRHYTYAIKQYQLYDVAFEKDEKIRHEKEEAYHFDDEMRDTAYFMPLQFSEEVMIGRNLELFQRRGLVKTIGSTWGLLSRDEKETEISQYRLTEDEISHIDRTNGAKKMMKKSS